ncbi:MAG: FUSC family protein [Propionibacteriaceae bacterium]
MSVLSWLRRHDAGLLALRRAARTAIVMPALFAFGTQVLHNPLAATFAAFGSFALLLLVDLSGTRRERLAGISALALTGAVFVCLGTLVSQTPWLAALTMAVVAFAVLFAGIVSSVVATASTTLLLAFVLPVATVGPVSTLPDRLAGWGLASVAAAVAVTVLWPAPPRDPLRGPTIEACRLVAARLRTDIAALTRLSDASPAGDDSDREAAAQAASEAVASLRRTFFASPNRPTGLGTASRTLVRLVDELGWLSAVLDLAPLHRGSRPIHPDVLAVKLACASVLEAGADLLDHGRREPDALTTARSELSRRVTALETSATVDLPVRSIPGDEMDVEFVDSLEPTFRAQELAFAVDAVGLNIDRTSQAESRTFTDRLLGRQPDGVGSAWDAARERAVAHLELHSVWLHNSLRGAVGLALAVLVADLSGVQHSFWVVLGTLSVLRSNALSTGQNVLRGLLGTAAGIVLGGVIVLLIGTNTTVLWVLLPICILIAGLAPAAISFAAGQAAFTLTLVILFNIIEPVGYLVGIIRIEDIALGCAVSLVVGLLFWPRGAGSALGVAVAEAYDASVHYLSSAVGYGVAQCHQRQGHTSGPGATRPVTEAAQAAAASRRLDDAFREYLAERGGKRLNLAEVTTLVTGVIAPRLAGDAVLDLWDRELGSESVDRTAAGTELVTTVAQIENWYAEFGRALTGVGQVPEPADRDFDIDARLIAAVRRDLADHDGLGTPTAVRMIWTGDHLDAVRRLQQTVVAPARVVARQR